MSKTPSTPGPRERLLDAGQRLFYSRGVTVGIDALLREANVARRSLYEHFGGKDGLVAAVVRRASDEDLAWYDATLSGDGTPRERILRVFDNLDALMADPQFRGCRYLATDLALVDRDHPAHQETHAYRVRLRALLARELVAAGVPDPDRVAEQLHLLIEGALVMGATHDGQQPALAARAMAASLLMLAKEPTFGPSGP